MTFISCTHDIATAHFKYIMYYQVVCCVNSTVQYITVHVLLSGVLFVQYSIVRVILGGVLCVQYCTVHVLLGGVMCVQ